MELVTQDQGYYPNYEMPLWYHAKEDFLPSRGLASRFRLILVEDGAGVLRLDQWRGAFIAPVLFCLNETERPELEQAQDVRAQALYFHPAIINDIFDFEVVRAQREGLSVSAKQDLYWLTPFIQRSSGYFRPINLGPMSVKRISELMHIVGYEIAAQSDANWPCRSRAYFLELLFVVARAYSNPETKDMASLAEPSRDMDAVIMYLHTHYGQKITISDLTHTFHTNRTTLTEAFRQATGLSVMSYLTRLRIQMASMLLRDTELDISQIMYRVGFRDNTHFGRIFRRYNDCTPSEYRHKYCWMLRDHGSHQPQ
jgi:AraC family L-rhamnose operon regulatory protein RhaS